MTVMCVSAVSYVIVGFTRTPLIGLIVGAALLILVLFFLRSRQKEKELLA